MELPYHLKTLEPLAGALDILRYMGETEAPTADVDEICEALDISDRTFGKAIRRLVTKGYVTMEGEYTYRLTTQGYEAVETLAEYDETAPKTETITYGGQITRRLVVAIPQTIPAQQPTIITVGLDGATDQDTGVLKSPEEMLLRVSVIHGQPAKPQDALLKLSNSPLKHEFQVVPDAYQQIRIRVQVIQLGPNPDDVNMAGGLYVDTWVTPLPDQGPSTLIAYGSDLTIQVLD